ncbi:MAG: carboxypeptidase-like regulatory domain-containing protein [Candidatus Altiarchaeota archaeon]
MKVFASCILVFALCSLVCAEGSTLIEGTVQDGNTGKSISEVTVEAYRSEDHSKAVNSTKTDEKGGYSMSVEPGVYYDVYLRTGDQSPNQRTNEAVKQDGVYKLNFNIVGESTFEGKIVEKYGLGLVLLAVAVVIGAIAWDHLGSKNRGPTPDELKAEKAEIEKMIEMTRVKYHKRQIDEETLKNIVKDKQERLIEIESKIRELDGKA